MYSFTKAALYELIGSKVTQFDGVWFWVSVHRTVKVFEMGVSVTVCQRPKGSSRPKYPTLQEGITMEDDSASSVVS